MDNQYVVVLDNPESWDGPEVIGPFPSKTEAGDYEYAATDKGDYTNVYIVPLKNPKD